jgi:carbon storage regulator CsrA
MLVLSRRANDRIVFPDLDINVQVLRVASGNVRIGIEAPPDVRVLRHELCESSGVTAESLPEYRAVRRFRHLLRNGLNAAKIGFHLALRHLETGDSSEARATLERALTEMENLERQSSGQEPFPAEARISETTSESNRRRALLVEDNPNECELLAGYLRISGYEVETARDGLEAMTRLATKQLRPNVVLLDMRMPRLNGPKMVSAIRRNPEYHGLKLFAVSGQSHEEACVPVGPSGVDRWFLKPVNPANLVEQLNRELNCEAISA